MAVRIHQELDRAGIFVADGLGQLEGGVSHSLAKPGRHDRRWALFDHLLVAALNGTISFAQMNHVAMLIGHDLEFDVMRVDDQFLDVNFRSCRKLFPLRDGRCENRH